MIQYINITGLDVSLYKVFNYSSMAILFLFFILQIKTLRTISPYVQKQHSNRKQVMVAFIELVTIYTIGMLLLWLLNKGFGKLFTHGNANYFGSISAWLTSFYLIPIVFRISSSKLADLLAPGLPLSLFVAKLACFFHGCCSGFELPGSFYFNQETGRYEFPVQLVEALVALALFFFLIWYKKKNKIPGSVFPIYIVIYSVSRFMTEFLRADFPNVLGPFDAYQVMSIVFLVIGLLLFSFVLIFNNARKKAQAKRESN